MYKFLVSKQSVKKKTQDKNSSDDRRLFMNVESKNRCGTAAPRTVVSTLSVIYELLKFKRYGGSATTEKQGGVPEPGEGTAIRHNVECMMSRVHNLLPHSIGGPYCVHAPDKLHSFDLCVARKV